MNQASIRVAQVLAGAKHGGAENFFVRLTGALNQSQLLEQKAFIRNHEERIQQLQTLGVQAQGFGFGGKLDFFGYHAYRKALADYAPDIVMTWMGRASQNTPASKKYLLINRLGHYYNLKYYRHANYWVGISQGICRHMIDGGFPAERIVHIPNFADETPVEPIARDSFDTPPDRPLVLAAGRLHTNKGFDILLQAMARVPDAILWLAGSGPEEQKLKSLCQQLKLESRVKFLGWRDDVTRLMTTADLFVCPSRHEGLGSIVMESWAHGCPIIATNSQGPGEVITDGESGLITQIDNINELTFRIQEVLENQKLRHELIEGGKKIYREKFCRDVIVQQYIDFYQRILPH